MVNAVLVNDLCHLNPRGSFPVRQRVGFVLQLGVLSVLPMVIVWQLFFGFPLLVMPVAVLVAVAVFSAGHALRKP
jgi:hypothetical protein